MNEIECPYCGYKFEDSDWHDGLGSDNTYDIECPNCEKEMEVYVEFVSSFSAITIDYYDCVECGKEYRYTGDWYPRPEKYKDIKDLRLCDSCRHRLVMEDYNKNNK